MKSLSSFFIIAGLLTIAVPSCQSDFDRLPEENQLSNALSANGNWQTSRVRAGGRVRQRITLAPGDYQLAWTDYFGYQPRTRRPSCTLNVQLIAPDGTVVSDTYNSSRNDNQLGVDPVTFQAATAGQFTMVFDEVDGHGDDFEIQLRALRPNATPPAGLTFYSAGSIEQDSTPPTRATIALAGGGADNDNAMSALLAGGGNGDVVVLRMDDTGGGYAEYFHGLGAASVVEMAFDPAHGNDLVTGQDLSALRALANSPWVADKIDHAEVVFFAGGNQTKYVDVFRDTLLAQAVTNLATIRKAAVGGTSAGMHVLSSIVHSPRGAGNSVTSDSALRDPYIGQGERSGTASLELSSTPFTIPRLKNMMTDTHWSQRNRQGRSIVFLARAIKDRLSTPPALHLIACDEGTAIVIDDAGIGRVYGTAGNAAWMFSTQTAADRCQDNVALEWTAGVRRVAVPATPTGVNTFSIDSWQPAGPFATQVVKVVNGKLIVP